MSLADRIVSLRKARGWSQEELADMIDVTRQSVSKWESGQSVPELDKIVMLSDLFEVSVDDLIKDGPGGFSYTEYEEEEPEQPIRRIVTMDEAEAFLAMKQRSGKWISLATALCIISPIALLAFSALSLEGQSLFGLRMNEDEAAGMGLVILLVIIAIAVAIFMFCGMHSAPYEYLEKEVFRTAPGVTAMVKARQQENMVQHTGFNVVGTVLCIIAVIPVIISGIFAEDNEMTVIFSICLFLVLIAIAVVCFIKANLYWENMQKLLQEGDYSRLKKKDRSFEDGIAGAYWCVVTAGYLAYSFITGDWGRSWIVWPVAGVLYGAVELIMGCLRRKK